MSVIEQAAKKLEELGRIGVKPAENFGRGGLNGDSGPTSSAGPGGEAGFQESAAVTSLHGQTGNGARVARVAPTRPKEFEIDIARLAQMGFITPSDPKSRIAEEFRDIKRPILRNAAGKGAAPILDGNLVMITSSLPGEGKSTTSVNLAMSIALELDYTVLLVDADVEKPSIPSILGLPGNLGLLDLLLDDELDVSDVLIKTNIDNLSILPSGRPQPRASELLSSEAMNRLLREMSSRYSDRILIFDSPPLLLSNESRTLAAHMGQVIVVVAAEQTACAEVKQSLAAIEMCPVKLLMLNKSRLAPGSVYGSYGGYGSYGYGHSK